MTHPRMNPSLQSLIRAWSLWRSVQKGKGNPSHPPVCHVPDRSVLCARRRQTVSMPENFSMSSRMYVCKQPLSALASSLARVRARREKETEEHDATTFSPTCAMSGPTGVVRVASDRLQHYSMPEKVLDFRNILTHV